MRKPLCVFARSCYDTKILPYTISLIPTSRRARVTRRKCSFAPLRGEATVWLLPSAIGCSSAGKSCGGNTSAEVSHGKQANHDGALARHATADGERALRVCRIN